MIESEENKSFERARVRSVVEGAEDCGSLKFIDGRIGKGCIYIRRV